MPEAVGLFTPPIVHHIRADIKYSIILCGDASEVLVLSGVFPRPPGTIIEETALWGFQGAVQGFISHPRESKHSIHLFPAFPDTIRR
jgi:hypothetical protein